MTNGIRAIVSIEGPMDSPSSFLHTYQYDYPFDDPGTLEDITEGFRRLQNTMRDLRELRKECLIQVEYEYKSSRPDKSINRRCAENTIRIVDYILDMENWHLPMSIQRQQCIAAVHCYPTTYHLCETRSNSSTQEQETTMISTPYYHRKYNLFALWDRKTEDGERLERMSFPFMIRELYKDAIPIYLSYPVICQFLQRHDMHRECNVTELERYIQLYLALVAENSKGEVQASMVDQLWLGIDSFMLMNKEAIHRILADFQIELIVSRKEKRVRR